jgi:UDP-N-acetylmuramate dehydrogenase
MSFELLQNVPLAEKTTFKIGGMARFFISAETENDVVKAVSLAKDNDWKLFVLGGGSNVLIADDGFDGLVLQINLKGISFNKNIVTAAAGEDWDEFVRLCVDKNLQGIECLSGIPGLVGGTPVQNVGAYGQEVSETIENVRVFDLKTNEIYEISNDNCKFSYRKSIFNSTEKNRFIVLAVTYKLWHNGEPKIFYKDLIKVFADKKPTLSEVREAVCRIRAEKGMMVRQGGFDSQSAGSFFKNPIIEIKKYDELCQELNETIPSFKVDDKKLKIPAAWLIEKSGFNKGYRLGNAGISKKHSLALTNCGDAKAVEIINLKELIQKKVSEKFALDLVPEPILVGFKNN